MRERRLPLGVDIGTGRVRIAAVAQQANGSARLLCAVGIDHGGDVEAALRQALQALDVPERRCVLSLPSAHAPVRGLRLPAMPRRERERVLRFEAAAMIDEAADSLAVRHFDLSDGMTLLAAARRERIASVAGLAQAASLRPVAIVHEALAYYGTRCLPLLDIGAERSTLVVQRSGLPIVRHVPAGGEAFTQSLARGFGISRDAAETRKRGIGLGGAALDALSDYVRALDATLLELRAREGVDVIDLYVAGNGARLAELRGALAERLGLRLRALRLSNILATDLPAGVDASSSADWFLAVAIAMQGAVAVPAAA